MAVGGFIPFLYNYVKLQKLCIYYMHLTSFSNTAAKEVGGKSRSKGNNDAFKQFFIRGASCRLPSVFCNEGTGWYVRNAVRISGKTV